MRRSSLFALMLALPLFALAQMPPSTTGALATAPSGCVPPATTSRWAAYNPSNLCVGSVACTNGATIISLGDLVGSNTATNSGGTTSPTYVTGAVNSLPAVSFTATNSQYLRLGTGLPQSGSITLYAVLKPVSVSGASSIVGVSAGHGIEWLLQAGTSLQHLLSQGAVDLGGSNTAVPINIFSTIAVTYNFSTGALAFYVCAGGTCTADGTATTTASFPNPTNDLGAGQDVGSFFDGQIAEWGYINSANLSGIAAWSQCKYGI